MEDSEDKKRPQFKLPPDPLAKAGPRHCYYSANSSLARLRDIAYTGSSEAERKEAVRSLYYLCRDAMSELHTLFKLEPEYLNGIAEKNFEAPWLTSGTNDSLALKEWLECIRLGKGLPVSEREGNYRSEYSRKGGEIAQLVGERWRATADVSFEKGEVIESHPSVWPRPDGMGGTSECSVPAGKAFSEVVAALGWEWACTFLPDPRKDQSSDEFKAWWAVGNALVDELGAIEELLPLAKREGKTKPASQIRTGIRHGFAAALRDMEG
ncbi:MAG: hypothetical protein CMO55_05350 [Verrucomicrobiales bacterium]|nr:hypothetical protein [Verrucomicrobiales bacterium]